MNTGVWGWDYAVAPNVPQWRKVHLDRVTGNLQVDTVSSALPLGAATAANQALIIADTGTLVAEQGRCYGWDSANWLPLTFEAVGVTNLRVRLYGGANAVLVGQSSAALAYTNYGIETFAILYGDDGTNLSRVGMLLAGADAVVNTLNTLGVASMLYGYNGTTWDRLRVESNVAFNLRVRLYAGANAIASERTTVAQLSGDYALHVNAVLRGAQRYALLGLVDNADARAVNAINSNLRTSSMLFGFNGANFDRLRTWGVGVLKVGRAEIDSTTIRHTGTGLVIAGAHNLYWVACSPSGANAEFELTDAIAAAGAVVYDHWDTDRHSEHLTFDPPMKFATGIYLETFTNMTSVVFCYV